MTLFQWLALPALVLIVLWDAFALVRQSQRRWIAWLRLCVWIAVGIAIAVPSSLSTIARALGIGRGTDLVLYVFVLVFVAGAFYFYSKTIILERMLTVLVRRQALREAFHGGDDVKESSFGSNEFPQAEDP